MLPFTIILGATAFNPAHTARLTVWHINPKHLGAVPVNMDSGNIAGDMFFDLWEEGEYASDALEGMQFHVFGLGDRGYRHFNSAAKFIDKKFVELGATRMQEVGLGDDQDDDKYETAYDEWLPDFWKIQNAPEPKDDHLIPEPSFALEEVQAKLLKRRRELDRTADIFGEGSALTEKKSFEKAELQAKFEEYDILGLGYVDHSVMPLVLKELGCHIGHRRLSQLLYEADHDANGSCNYKEFVAILNSNALIGHWGEPPAQTTASSPTGGLTAPLLQTSESA